MQDLSPHIVTQLDYNGHPYTSTVYLTAAEAAQRIVNGRLLSAAAASARNYARLWNRFINKGTAHVGNGPGVTGEEEIENGQQDAEDYARWVDDQAERQMDERAENY